MNISAEITFNNHTTLYVFDKNGKFGIGPDSASVELKYDTIVVGYLDYNLAKKGGKWGTIGDDNKIRLPLQYDEIAISYFEGHVTAKKDSKWGLIYEDENVLVLPFQYDTILYSKHYTEKGIERNTFIVSNNGKFGIVNDKNEIILPIEYDEISNWIEYGPDGHNIKKNNKWGFINKKGKLLIPCIYEQLSYSFDLQKFKVQRHGKLGIIGYDNLLFLPIEFLKMHIEHDFSFNVDEYGNIDDKQDTLLIVVQKSDSSWSFLSRKNGSVIEDNVDKRLIFEKYKTDLFGNELIQSYIAKIEEGFSLELDTFTKNVVDDIIQSKAGLFVEFPDLHKEFIDFDPWRQIENIFKIRAYISSLGFEMAWSGTRVDGRSNKSNSYINAEGLNCACELALTLYKTNDKGKYKMIESIKCASKKRYRVHRFHDYE